MNSNQFEFYEDDEGISVDINLDVFNSDKTPIVYLESSSYDDKMIEDINFIIDNKLKFFELSKKEICNYVKAMHDSKNINIKLIKVYIFPDIRHEFGFMFRWEDDIEHGIGVKFFGLEVKKIGSAEVAFL
ncbi:hypothetical protein [Celerinatantimonas sp. YJH-8]|uniref:hypothetical protein n=1 Tax=Celerinatantimonas sp. YJH-8 TaxID=3228714 RepID=UPI0038C3F7E0